MRVLFINSVVDYGSTGRIVRDLANSLKERGHETLICYGRKKIKEDADTFYFGNKLATLGHIFMTRFFGRHGLHSIKPTKELIKQIEKFKPKVIHLHNLHGYYLNYKILFEYFSKCSYQIIWTFHDCWPMSGSSAHFDYDGCKEWDNGCVECNSTKSYPKVIGFKNQKSNFYLKRELFTSMKNITIITPSLWLAELTQKTFFNKFPIKIIPNGIDLNVFNNSLPRSDFKDKIKVLGVSNVWNEKKGLKDFISLSDYLDGDMELTLVGLSKKQIKKISSKIIAKERTSNLEELIKEYSSANVYINFSVEETMGLTTVEALACGTPVIVYNSTAVPEVVTEKCGIVLEKNDFLSAVNAIRASGKLRSEDCVEVAKRYSLNNMITAYIDEYEKC